MAYTQICITSGHLPHQPAALGEGGQTIRAEKPKMENAMLPDKFVPIFKFLKSRHYLASGKQIADLIWYTNWLAAGGRGYCSNMKAAGVRAENPEGAGLIDRGVSQSACLGDLDMINEVRLIKDDQYALRRRARESARLHSTRLTRAAQSRRDFINSL